MHCEKKAKDHKGILCLLFVATFFLFSTVIVSNPPLSNSVQKANISFSNSLSPTPANIATLGADGVGGGIETQAFLDNLSSQGLKWNDACLCSLTPTILTDLTDAGIRTIGMIYQNPETSCGSGVLQSEAEYKATIQSDVNNFSSIHDWDYGAEVQANWCNISPQNYFQGLVWAYEVITGTTGHSSDTFRGPRETIWTEANAPPDNDCYDQNKLSWFESFWAQRITDPFGTWTPANVLTYVNLDVYTVNLPWTNILTSGTCAGQTISQMLAGALNAYYGAEGKTKQIVISETGIPSGNTTGSYNDQATWYQEMVPFYNSLGFVKGVFAYDLYDTQSVLWGLFASNLQPKPAWFVYQSYLSGTSLTSTTSSSSAGTSSTSVSPTITVSSTSTTKTSTITSSTSLSASTSSSSKNQSSSTSFSSPAGSSQLSSSATTSGSLTKQTSTKASPVSSLSPNSSRLSLSWLTALVSALAQVNDPDIAYGLAVYQFCLIGVLVFTILRSRKRDPYNLSNQGQNWWSSILKALFSWTEIGQLLPQSTKQFGFYENAATRGINAEGYLPVRKYHRSNSIKRQTERTGRQRKARATKASKDSKDILNQASEKKDSQQKRKKRASKKVRKDI
jgi:hypothetical protein